MLDLIRGVPIVEQVAEEAPKAREADRERERTERQQDGEYSPQARPSGAPPASLPASGLVQADGGMSCAVTEIAGYDGDRGVIGQTTVFAFSSRVARSLFLANVACLHRESCRHRQNKTEIKRCSSEWEPICKNVSEDVVLQAVENTRKVELGVGSLGWSKNIWKPRPPHFNKQGVRRLILRCPFRGAANANCCAQLRITEDDKGRWTLERNRTPHADHTQNHKKKGLSKFMKASTTCPSKAGLTVGNVMRRMRDEHGAVTQTERRQIQGVLKRQRIAERCAVVPKELQGSFGGLKMWAEYNSRENLAKRGEFGIHTTYVCGTLQIDEDKNTINMAYSTENLLLNAYRQGQHGIPSIVQVDCTHRVVLEGHACMLFGTVDTAQHFHVVRL